MKSIYTLTIPTSVRQTLKFEGDCEAFGVELKHIWQYDTETVIAEVEADISGITALSRMNPEIKVS